MMPWPFSLSKISIKGSILINGYKKDGDTKDGICDSFNYLYRWKEQMWNQSGNKGMKILSLIDPQVEKGIPKFRTTLTLTVEAVMDLNR